MTSRLFLTPAARCSSVWTSLYRPCSGPPGPSPSWTSRRRCDTSATKCWRTTHEPQRLSSFNHLFTFFLSLSFSIRLTNSKLKYRTECPLCVAGTTRTRARSWTCGQALPRGQGRRQQVSRTGNFLLKKKKKNSEYLFFKS